MDPSRNNQVVPALNCEAAAAQPPATEPRRLAELMARQNGYTGVFPPPPRPRIDSAADLERVLDRIAAGELSANNLAAAGDHIMRFFASVPASRYFALAERLIDIVLFDELPAQRKPAVADGTPAVRVRIRAVQAVLKPMLQVLELAPKLLRQRGAPSNMTVHLYQCVYAFMAPFGGEIMGRVANKLHDLATGSRSAENAVRAAQAAADLTVLALRTLVNASLGLEQTGALLDEETRQQAQAEVERMIADVAAGQKARRRPPTERDDAAG